MDALAISERMRRVASKDTKPELFVRRLVFSMGYRYRLHTRKLPGAPDLVFPSRRKVIFIHGCFWHRHRGCRRATFPATNVDAWRTKFDATIKRDKRNRRRLTSSGWQYQVIWECSLKETDLADRIRDFLGS